MTKQKNIAFIELGGSHEEVLFPQIEILAGSGFNVSLIIRTSHFNRIKPIRQAKTVLCINDEKNFFQRAMNLRRVLNFIKTNNIHSIIINTAQGAFIRDLCFFLPPYLNLTGISHNPQKIGHSFTQKFISRKIKKYLVLNDYILKNLPQLHGLSYSSFYPVFYPHKHQPKNDNTLRVAIPGAIDFNRRDYEEILNNPLSQVLNKNIQFIFLGRCKSEAARKYREAVETKFLKKQSRFFDEFIPEARFFSILKTADIILPLITPGIKNFQLYKKYKVSGSINLAFGMKIPLLMHESLKSTEDYQTAAIFYKEGQLFQKLNEIHANPDSIAIKKKDIEKEKKFNPEFQQKQYIDFVLR